MTKALRHIREIMLASTAILLCACNAMHEDLPECETLVRVAIKYDYNVQRADMFHDHAGMVRLFAIDADNGTVLRDTTISNRDNQGAIKNNSDRYFNVEFRDLPLGRNLRFMAVALQRPYDETLAHPEDKFVGTFPAIGASETNLSMTLTRSELDGGSTRCPAVKAPSCGLDTLWMGRSTKVINMPARREANVVLMDTISMVRDTKYLSLNLRQLDNPAGIKAEDFYVEITAANGRLAWDNTVLPDDPLLYTPHAQWTNETLDSEDNVTERAAHYDISFSRLMYYMGAEAAQNATLCIYRKDDGTKVADINLPSMLAQGRKAFELYNYSPQEYLDREYDYNLDLFLLNDQWQYMYVKVNIMAWAIRIQRETL